MKIRNVIGALAALFMLGSANAVTLTLTGIASTSVGLVTDGASSTLLGGTVYFYSSTSDLTASSLTGLTQAADKVAFFAAALENPVSIRSGAFTAGAFTNTGSSELGPAGNNLYMLIVSADGTKVGAYQNIVVPALGAVLMNPSNMVEDLVGTSTLQTIGGVASGYQLVGIPEPSIALLGALGVFGLIRRRR